MKSTRNRLENWDKTNRSWRASWSWAIWSCNKVRRSY